MIIRSGVSCSRRLEFYIDAREKLSASNLCQVNAVSISGVKPAMTCYPTPLEKRVLEPAISFNTFRSSMRNDLGILGKMEKCC